MIDRKTLLTFLFTAIASTAFCVQPLHAADPIGNDKPREIVIGVAIPGMPQHNCKDAINVDPKTNLPKTCVADFTEYVSWFYRFFAGVVGMLAAVMVLYGGYQWMTAGGNASHVQQAKTTMYSSLIAIVLTLGTYLILNTINPQLTNLSVRGITNVKQIGETCSSMARSRFPKSVDSQSDVYACGKEVKTTDGTTCIWDVANEENQVCRYHNGVWGVTTIQGYCEEEGNSCSTVDAQLEVEKDSDFQPKITHWGCNQLKTDSTTKCWAGPLLYSWVEKNIHYPATSIFHEAEDYEATPVNCFEPGAKDKCWKSDKENRQEAINCGGILDAPQPCTNPTSSSRAVAGAYSVCLVKKGKIGSTEKGDYTCWHSDTIRLPYTPYGSDR